ncbi:MAG: HIT family protein [Anaerolineae bacterium]|nr:HIT family protein [Anaerolineae bacterium]
MTNPPCVFCDIIRGQSPASVVYTDEQAIAFMDIQPVIPGHLLIIPRVHAAYLADLDPDTGAHLFRVGMKLAAAMRRSALRCEGINFFLADGEAAGQDVFHVHLHILPRFQGDGFGFRFPPGYWDRPSRDTLDALAAQIREAL